MPPTDKFDDALRVTPPLAVIKPEAVIAPVVVVPVNVLFAIEVGKDASVKPFKAALVILRVCPEPTVTPPLAVIKPEAVIAAVVVVPVNVLFDIEVGKDASVKPFKAALVILRVCPEPTVTPPLAVIKPEAVIAPVVVVPVNVLFVIEVGKDVSVKPVKAALVILRVCPEPTVTPPLAVMTPEDVIAPVVIAPVVITPVVVVPVNVLFAIKVGKDISVKPVKAALVISSVCPEPSVTLPVRLPDKPPLAVIRPEAVIAAVVVVPVNVLFSIEVGKDASVKPFKAALVISRVLPAPTVTLPAIPPVAVIKPVKLDVPPTLIFPPIPAPPDTINAPVSALVLVVVFSVEMIPPITTLPLVEISLATNNRPPRDASPSTNIRALAEMSFLRNKRPPRDASPPTNKRLSKYPSAVK